MRLFPAMRVIAGATLAVAVALNAGESHPRVTVVHGRCTNCPAPFDLRQIEFLTDTIGWASASRLPPGNGTGLATVLHTTNGGRQWKRLPFVWQSGAEEPPPFSFVDRNNGWVASFDMDAGTGRLSRTRDGGRTWMHRACDPPLHRLQFVDLGIGYAVSDSSFRATTDGGKTWSSVGLPLDATQIMSFRDRMRGVIAGWSASGPLRVIVTRDGGKHWTEARLPTGIDGSARTVAWLNSERALLAIRSSNSDVSTLLETRDGGATWRRHPYEGFQGAGKRISTIVFASGERGAVFFDDATSRRSFMASTSDGGATWRMTQLPASLSDCDMRDGSFRCASGSDVVKIDLGN